jgi:hypothetical protein
MLAANRCLQHLYLNLNSRREEAAAIRSQLIFDSASKRLSARSLFLVRLGD